MEPMIDLEHLVETERIQNRARRDAGDRVLMWFNAGCMMVIGAGVAAGGLYLVGAVARVAWGCVRAGWGLF